MKRDRKTTLSGNRQNTKRKRQKATLERQTATANGKRHMQKAKGKRQMQNATGNKQQANGKRQDATADGGGTERGTWAARRRGGTEEESEHSHGVWKT